MNNQPTQPQSHDPIAALRTSRTALLTTYRRNGQAVGTPVTVMLLDGNAYFTTWTTTGKVKRITNNPQVTLAPCTQRGRVTGPTVAGTASRLQGAEADKINAIGRRSFGGKLWLWIYRLRGWQPVYYKISPQ